MSFYIAGTGSALPQKQVTNDDLAAFLDTSDEWIRTRTGIRSRHVLTDERLDDLAIVSAKAALAEAGVSGDGLDLILCATMRGDTYTPSLACIVAEAVGATAPAFDLNAACVGVLYAMEIADAFISSGKAKTVLIVSAEAMSKLLDWTDRASCVLFGDGAGAMVVRAGEGRLSGVLSTAPDSQVIRMPNFEGLNSPYNKIAQEKPALHMDGGEVYKFAVNAMGRNIEEACARGADARGYRLVSSASGEPAHHRRQPEKVQDRQEQSIDQHRTLRQHERYVGDGIARPICPKGHV